MKRGYATHARQSQEERWGHDDLSYQLGVSESTFRKAFKAKKPRKRNRDWH